MNRSLSGMLTSPLSSLRPRARRAFVRAVCGFLGILTASVAGFSSAHAVPAVSFTTPTDLAVGVARNSNITVKLAGGINSSTVGPHVLQVSTNQRGRISGTFTWNQFSRLITFNPDVDFRG